MMKVKEGCRFYYIDENLQIRYKKFSSDDRGDLAKLNKGNFFKNKEYAKSKLKIILDNLKSE